MRKGQGWLGWIFCSRSGLALSKWLLCPSPAGHKGPRDGSWVSSDRDLSIPKQIVFAAVGCVSSKLRSGSKFKQLSVGTGTDPLL